MLFSHDVEHSLACVVDLVNTGPNGAGEEQLAELDDLRSFVERHEVSEVGALTRTDLLAVQALRTRIRPIFGSTSDQDSVRVSNTSTIPEGPSAVMPPTM